MSIIIPVYNGANYMREAIDSALAQTWPNTEVVVVDDGSRDNGATREIALSYGKRIVFVEKANGGVASALNAGIAAMTGDIFCWLSHDDRHHLRKTEIQVNDWIAHGRRLEVLFSDYCLIDAASDPITQVTLDHAMLTEKPLYPLLRGSIHGCSVFIPKAIIDDVGNFDEGRPTTQDYDLWRRMLARYPFRHMPLALIDSRWHDEQGSKKIDHVREATSFWLSTWAGVERTAKVAHEGSAARFDLELAGFLTKNNLIEAAEAIRSSVDQMIRGTLISVVMPVYSRVDLAVGALDSLQRQTHQAWELIVVDDGSTQDMSMLKRRVEEFGNRARYVRQSNAGPASARNHGWSLANGEYVAFLDSDDLFLPRKLELQLQEMEQSGAAFSHTSYFRAIMSSGTAPTIMRSGEGNTFPEIVGSCGIATPTVMLRRSLFDDGFNFDENLQIGEDVCLWMSIADRFGVTGMPRPLSVVRTSAGSAAYDKDKLRQGIDNIIAYIIRSPSLAKHVEQVARLQGARNQLSDN